MITIEGLGGKGGVWCAVRFARGMTTNVAHIDAYSFDVNNILSAAPTAINLPPIGLASNWYSCKTSPYGPRLGQLEVGTLFDVTTSPNQPNPCEHSTAKGGLMLAGANSTLPNWYNRKTDQLVGGDKTYYTLTGEKAIFCQGSQSTYINYHELAYNRLGILTDSYNGRYSVTYSMLMDWMKLVGSSVSLSTSSALQTTWLCTVPDIASITATAAVMQRVECKHVSSRVWTETKWIEYHHNASYMPLSPISKDTGVGYIVASSQRIRTITMTAIQSTGPTVFTGRFEAEETVTYFGRPFGVAQKSFTGSVSSKYTFDAPISTLAPGLATGSYVDVQEAFGTYCAQAKSRAQLLFKAKHATTARSNALADVKGLESNWIENLSQVRGTTKAILPLIAAWRAVKTGNIMAGKRALVDAYLSYMYVVAPGVRDYNDLKNNLGNISNDIAQNRLSDDRRRGKLTMSSPVCEVIAELAYYCTLHLKLKDNPVAGVCNALERLGLNPSASNIWDLIPFSFVVDWFTHIGPVLSRLDAYENNALLRDLKSEVETFKVLWPLTEAELVFIVGHAFSVTTPIQYSWYDRRIFTTLGSYDPFAGQSNDGLSVSQMTQGGALLSSHRR